MRGIHRWPVTSPQKGPVTRKMFPFDDDIISCSWNQQIFGDTILVPDSDNNIEFDAWIIPKIPLFCSTIKTLKYSKLLYFKWNMKLIRCLLEVTLPCCNSVICTWVIYLVRPVEWIMILLGCRPCIDSLQSNIYFAVIWSSNGPILLT